MPNYGIGYDGGREQTFKEYLQTEVFTFGTYTYNTETDVYGVYGDIMVAEHDDGMGYVIQEDMRSLIEDDNVKLLAVDDGWLCLRDER